MLDRIVEPSHVKLGLGNNIVGSVDDEEWFTRILHPAIGSLSSEDHSRAVSEWLPSPTYGAVGPKYAIPALFLIMASERLPVFQGDLVAPNRSSPLTRHTQAPPGWRQSRHLASLPQP